MKSARCPKTRPGVRAVFEIAERLVQIQSAGLKTRLIFSLFVAVLFVPIAVHAKKATDPDDRPKIGIIVRGNFEFFKHAFETLEEERKWPVKFVVQRHLANLPRYDQEVTIHMQYRGYAGGKPTMRGWVDLNAHGEKQDFGIISVSQEDPRRGEDEEKYEDKFYLAFANAVADRIEPILFPKVGEPVAGQSEFM